MRLSLLFVSTALVSACSPQDLAVNSTSKVLAAAQPSLQQESDYELARNAIPGALKTIEGFWVSGFGNGGAKERLERILAEGYCQYGTGFVEDDWELAKFNKDLPAIEYNNDRSTHIFTRCLNFSLRLLGKRWQKEIFGTPEEVAKLLKDTGKGHRFELMFAGAALGGLVNHNLTRIEMISYLGTVQGIMERVIEIDQKSGPPANKAHAALPYLALGMIYSAKGKAMGGEPDKAKAMFEKAFEISGNRFLLAKTFMAYRVGLQTNDQKFFHDNLVEVLNTAPSIWPEQRLANEIAHRRARRYLSHEKELFQ
ncbi:MAG TPA: TRAP transporter TatT component family protein [Kofleriaceae bacterium]|nr:TRAP transporter TatT component family protein [Kofleriaceae bacterium]